MNKKEQNLFSKMIIFTFFIILCFGLIIIKEKEKELKIKKIDSKFNTYINNNYKNISKEITINKTKYKNKTYIKKITNKDNHNLYFYLTYSNNKITSSYTKDYLEGKTLFNYIEKELNKDLKNKNKKYNNLNISIDLKLNNTTDIIKKRLINNKYNTPIYTINDNINIDLNIDNINNYIINLNNYLNNIGFNPKYYNITINDTKEITNSIIIKFKSDIIESINIGETIINNNKDIINKYNIEIKYLN